MTKSVETKTPLHDKRGRFAKGNQAAAGGGNGKVIKHVRALRRAVIEELTVDDVRKIFRKLIREAQRGNSAAAREVLDRAIGKASEGVDLLERLEELEQAVAQVTERRRSWQ